MAKKGEEKDTKHYKLRCICVNCGKDFEARISKGVVVAEHGTEENPFLSYDSMSGNKEFIKCPNCKTTEVRKRLSLADVK